MSYISGFCIQFCLRSGVVLNSNIWWPSDCEKWLKGKSKLKINFFQTHYPYSQKRNNGNPKEQNQIEVVSKIRYSAKRVSEAFLSLCQRWCGRAFFFRLLCYDSCCLWKPSTWSFCFTNWKDNPSEWQSKTFCNLVLRNRYLKCQRKKRQQAGKIHRGDLLPLQVKEDPQVTLILNGGGLN